MALSFESDLREYVFDSVQSVLNIALGSLAHVSDTEYLTRQGGLSAGNYNVVVCPELADQRGGVNAARDAYRGYGIGGISLIAWEQGQTERLYAVAGELPDGGVSFEYGAHALGEKLVESVVEREHDRHGGCVRRLSDLIILPVLGHVEIELGHRGLRVGGPGAVVEAEEGESWREHPALLGRSGHNVEAPGVGGHWYGGHAADAVHENELVELALYDVGDGLEVVL